jgi:hypothetical protein
MTLSGERTALPWTSDPWRNWSGTCDWGDCGKPSVTVRWEDQLKEWLPVCADHAPDRGARCAALPPNHDARECEVDVNRRATARKFGT